MEPSGDCCQCTAQQVAIAIREQGQGRLHFAAAHVCRVACCWRPSTVSSTGNKVGSQSDHISIPHVWSLSLQTEPSGSGWRMRQHVMYTWHHDSIDIIKGSRQGYSLPQPTYTPCNSQAPHNSSFLWCLAHLCSENSGSRSILTV